MGRKKHKKYLEIGDRFGDWEVTGADEEKNKNKPPSKWFYECECQVCGNVKTFGKRSLVGKETTECNHVVINKKGRTCTGECGKFKLWEEFSKNTGSSTGHQSQCKMCENRSKEIKRRENNIPLKRPSRELYHGEKFSYWTVLEKDEKKSAGKKQSLAYYFCICECGTKKSVSQKTLINKGSTNCGCKRAGYSKNGRFKVTEEGRECTECGEFKEQSEFGPRPEVKSGMQSKCKVCMQLLGLEYYNENKEKIAIRNKEYYNSIKDEKNKRKREMYGEEEQKKAKEYYDSNREKILEQKKEYHEKNKEEKNKKSREYYSTHKEEAKESSKNYRKNNKEKITKQRKEYVKNKLQTDDAYRFEHNLRARISMALKAQGGEKSHKSIELVGCIPKQAVSYLEASSKEGYKFKDVSPKGLNVDHIIPCKWFDLTDEMEQRICFNYRNLQLLPWGENSHKYTDLPPENQLIDLFFIIAFNIMEGVGYDPDFRVPE